MKIDGTNALNGNFSVNIEKAKKEEEKALNNIAAIRAISGEDTASMVLADSLLADIGTYSQGVRNANDAIGMLQIADGALSGLTDSAQRLNELSVAYSNPALNSDQRAMLESEAGRLTESMSQTVNSTTFNGKSVFQANMTFQTGHESVSVSAQAPSGETLDIKNQDSILSYINNVNQTRSDIGAGVNQMVSLVNSHLTTITNLTESESALQNNDIAENMNKLNSAKLKENATLFAQAHNVEYLQKKVAALLG